MARIIHVLLVSLAMSGAMSWCQKGGVQASGKVSGTVYRQGESVSLLSGINVRFEDGVVGHAVTVQTDGNGKYEAILPSGAYKMVVKPSDPKLCGSNRPRFVLKPGAYLQFSFTLVPCATVDFVFLPGSRSVDAPLPPIYCMLDYLSDHGSSYYDVDYIHLGDNPDDYVALIHGACHKRGQKILYEPAPVLDHPDARTPVTIIFGTYTILADSAIFDQQRKSVTADGKVSIFDGTSDPPRMSHCVQVSLADKDLKPALYN